ncbi:MAG: hypothetical protein RL407_1324 [Bacteroidota bacterium]|jgi:uncharacterized membrane protein YhaH (DUF805 family)
MKKKYLNLSPEIQEYIEYALSDGKITTKEVELIKRKAKEFGDDLDELELVLSKIQIELEQQDKSPEPEYFESIPKFGLLDSYILSFKNYSNFKGRSSRSEFWYFILANFIILFTVFVVIGVQGESFGEDESNLLFLGLFSLLYPAIVFFPFLSLCSRRLHDISFSFWFALIPIYNLILFFKAGEIGKNKYGDDPYKTVLTKKIQNKNSFEERITNTKLETIGGTMFAIGATSHEAIELKIIDFHQLDQVNKWLWIIGGILIITPKSYNYLLKKYRSK